MVNPRDELAALAADLVNDHRGIPYDVIDSIDRIVASMAPPTKVCSGCLGTRWTDDENWSPTFPETWDGTRSPGDGLIPCGFCNLGGWDVPVADPAAQPPAVTRPGTEHGVGFVDKVGIECLCRWTTFFNSGGWIDFNAHLAEARRDSAGLPLGVPVPTDGWQRGDWMQTFTGQRFYPLNPRPEEIDSADIAHALSLLCRYGGHVTRFYSVAEHCILMAEAVAPEHALYALLHDATEAYVCDVPRPLKRQLPGYKEIEDRVWQAIVDRFGLNPSQLPAEVKEADNRILLTERAALMPNTAYSWSVDDLQPLPVSVEGWAPEVAEQRYLAALERLVP